MVNLQKRIKRIGRVKRTDTEEEMIFILSRRLSSKVLHALHAQSWQDLLTLAIPELLDQSNRRFCPVSIIRVAKGYDRNHKNCNFTGFFQRGGTYHPECQACGNPDPVFTVFMIAAQKRLDDTGVYYLGDEPHLCNERFMGRTGAFPNASKGWLFADLIGYYRKGYATSTLVGKESKDRVRGFMLGQIENGAPLKHADQATRDKVENMLLSRDVIKSDMPDADKIRWLERSGLRDKVPDLVPSKSHIEPKRLTARMKDSHYNKSRKAALLAGLTRTDKVECPVDAIPKVTDWDAIGGKPRRNKDTATAQAFKQALADADEATK